MSAIRNKYNARKMLFNGKEFDSKKEVKRYRLLLEREQKGEISDLQTQVKYILIPTQREPDTVGVRGGIKRGKVIEQECAYYADFQYTENGCTVVEDTKGYRKGQAYAVFTIKRKLMLERYGIRIREV